MFKALVLCPSDAPAELSRIMPVMPKVGILVNAHNLDWNVDNLEVFSSIYDHIVGVKEFGF